MRRTRFTVTVSHETSNEVEKKVILAYDALGAGDYYATRGYAVLDVKRGDHRKAARVAAARAVGGFRVDQDAFRDACDLLGLTLPVRLRFNGRHGKQQGNYQFGGDHHRIMLKSYQTPEAASSTLWHELTHAMQAERGGTDVGAWSASVSRENARYSYRMRPSEVEAREMSETMADVPLCR